MTLYKKKQAKEAAALQKYETELRDSTDYFRWRAEGEKIDEAKKLKRVEQVRLEVEASHVRAAECIAQNLAKKEADCCTHEGGTGQSTEKEREGGGGNCFTKSSHGRGNT